MNNKNKSISTLTLTLLLCIGGILGMVTPSFAEQPFSPVANEMINSGGISWSPKVNYQQIILSLSRPDGTVYKKTFSAGNTPYLDISTIVGNSSGEGAYTYELKVISNYPSKVHYAENEGKTKKIWPKDTMPLKQTGYFLVQYGSIISKNSSEMPSRTMDVVHNDDEIVTGGLCVGPDCKTDGTEIFGTDTLKLKSNNIRLFLDDTSNQSGYAANDWRIMANSPDEGGGNFFSIQDATSLLTPFTIKAGAPESSLYVDDYGRVGLGTAVPAASLHLVGGEAPNFRLEQDTSQGFPAQTWDIIGNDAGFSVQDTSHSSNLPFRIQTLAPNNALCIKSDGKIGIGTWTPLYAMEMVTTGKNCALVTNRTDGAGNFMNATTSHAQFGSISNHPVRILVNRIWKFMVNPDGSLEMASGATCSVGGVWTNASSRALKENINFLSSQDAIQTLTNLNPVTYNYKVDKAEKHVGFIAEDVPELVASNDHKTMSPMDVVAVLTKVVQDQQKTLENQQQTLQQQQKFLQEQQLLINQLKEKIQNLEKK